MNKKKANMAYWDMIDDLADEYVKGLMAMSHKEIPQDEEEFEEDFDEVVTELSKEITEFATKLLKERLDAEFPYVEEDY